ncbi:MAG: FAD-binding protein, partial [Candidatus Methylomirabilales bacterium]
MIQDKARIIKELEKIVGPNGVVHEEDELRVYETDGLTIFKAMPDVVVLASTAEEVTQLIKLCEREKIPYVPRGAGTGLSGGALPLD